MATQSTPVSQVSQHLKPQVSHQSQFTPTDATAVKNLDISGLCALSRRKHYLASNFLCSVDLQESSGNHQQPVASHRGQPNLN